MTKLNSENSEGNRHITPWTRALRWNHSTLSHCGQATFEIRSFLKVVKYWNHPARIQETRCTILYFETFEWIHVISKQYDLIASEIHLFAITTKDLKNVKISENHHTIPQCKSHERNHSILKIDGPANAEILLSPSAMKHLNYAQTAGIRHIALWFEIRQ